jgi:hypothetical protein
MKTLLLFIGTVLRSRIIQRKGLGAIPAIYKLILYWWTWTPPQREPQVSAVSEHQEQSSGFVTAERVKPIAQWKALVGHS